MIQSFSIGGRGRTVTFPSNALLAPMDGVTDPAFRGLVLGLGHAGGAVTEFVRITTGPMSAAVLRREIGPRVPGGPPVGLQVMAPGPEFLAETVVHAETAGADWVDLNFGCPVKRVFDKCAGSALLAHPDRLEEMVRCAAGASGLPVSAKVRAGIEDDSRLDEILHAVAAGGAAMVTLHARLRTDSYATPARWERIARAAALLRRDHPGVVLVGNGGVDRAEDGPRMMRETGCDAVMVGRAALADPWIFREMAGGAPASRAEAAAFAVRYLEAMGVPGSPRAGTGKAKQLVRWFRAGGLFEGREGERRRLMVEAGGPAILDWFRAAGVSGSTRGPSTGPCAPAATAGTASP
jgi:tRNA-dihydrouridine synthase